jgi:hypothetical protein
MLPRTHSQRYNAIFERFLKSIYLNAYLVMHERLDCRNSDSIVFVALGRGSFYALPPLFESTLS